MTQTVPFLRGQTATVDLLNAALVAATMPGLKKTVTFTVASKIVSVTPHVGVFGNGVAVIESSVLDIDTTKYFSTGAQAFNGTLCYILDPSLYKKPELVIRRGITAPVSDDLVFVVGWVRYPGSNVALAPAHFTSAPVSSLAFNLPLGERTGYLHFDSDTGAYSWDHAELTGDHKILVNADDPKAGYLADKIGITETVELSINEVTRKLEARLRVPVPKVTVSTEEPSGTPDDGDVWFQIQQ